MKLLSLPYGNSFLPCEVPDSAAIITSHIDNITPDAPGSSLVQQALAHPIGSRPLHELAEGVRDAVIIISDHTRPVPSKDILPAMLRELRLGNPDIDVTLLVATGCHRLTTKEELRAKLGDKIFREEKIRIHDCDAPDSVSVGVLPSGAPLVIDSAAANAGLLVAEGFIEPHFFAGFSGGRKSVLPGVCARKTVLGNHCSRFIHSEFARTGILDHNPIHTDMEAAGRMAKLRFIVNVVIDSDHRTAAAFAGDFIEAHRAGCEYLKRMCLVSPIPGDIVVTTNGGAPMDQNIYQCVKCMTAAEASAKKGAVIIVCARCADGIGGKDFYRDLAECESPAALYDRIMSTSQEDTLPDQWQSQVLARVLMKHKVIFVTDLANKDAIEAMKMTYAPDFPAALRMAQAEKGENASVTVIPNGIGVIVGQED